MASGSDFIFWKMGFFWVFFSALFSLVFKVFLGFVSGKSNCVERLKRETDSSQLDSVLMEEFELQKPEKVVFEEDETKNNHLDSVSMEESELPKLEKIYFEEDETNNNQLDSVLMEEFELPKLERVDFEEDETPKFAFKFEFQTYKEDMDSGLGSGSSPVSSINSNKYEFKTENCLSGFIEEPQNVSFTVKELFTHSNEEKANDVEEESHLGCDQNVEFLSENDFVVVSSDSDSDSEVEVEVSSPVSGSTHDGFLSDGDFEEKIKVHKLRSADSENGNEEVQVSNLNNSSNLDKEMASGSDVQSAKSESMNNNSSASVDSDEANRLETLWEHQDLIEQLKMELKKVRAIGLPTILEESESPKIMEDLKPWKIDDNKFVHHEDTMGELNKFYRSYRERMRKFDIFNYQKMYAIGFLQAKDPFQSISQTKRSNPGVMSIFAQNFLTRRGKSECDPMKKFIDELHSDLEVVYVGQLCLSWEILHWQYEKSLELWDSDPYNMRKYNEVAGEFQQFQVLLQRFIENEPFEGPRVQSYIKNRCILRNLLQVPVIREDKSKEKRSTRARRRDEYTITSETLVEIMEESIRVFWRFVRADKDTNLPTQKSRKGTQIEPNDVLDLELLSEVKTCLQKKERKLKEVLKSGNCVLRKFRKNEAEAGDQVLYFFSQVDMKLVARVLNMSKVSNDQLIWCRNKLQKIEFVHRKIHVEPCFLLFPC